MFLRFEESTLHQSALQNVLYLKKNQFLAYKLSQHIALLLKKNAHINFFLQNVDFFLQNNDFSTKCNFINMPTLHYGEERQNVYKNM